VRISIREDDPGYNLEKSVRATVFLDGVRLDQCFTADEELGIAACFKTDANGNLIILGDAFDEIVLSGDVKIELSE